MSQKRSLIRTAVSIMGVLFGVASAQTHNLTCYAILEPSSGFVENAVAFLPNVAIANLGDSPESNVLIRFVAIRAEDGDTTFADSVIIDNFAPYDSLEIEMPNEWTPESQCKDYVSEEDGPFVEYELYGIVFLATDEAPENDTVCDTTTCLWKHDAGVVILDWPEEPDMPPDHYFPGSTITPTAIVENFGMSPEYDVPVRLEVRDMDSSDVLLWHNVQPIAFIDWRGNDSGNPYVADVTFPPYFVIVAHDQRLEARVELIDDDCPDDDYSWRIIDFPDDTSFVEEDKTGVAQLNIELSGSGSTKVSFTLPHASRVRLDVFDATGRQIMGLADGTYQAGEHEISWDRRDDRGKILPRGVYMIVMRAEEFNATQKVVIR